MPLGEERVDGDRWRRSGARWSHRATVPGIPTQLVGYRSAGALGTVPTGEVHDVVNAGSADATSLHVYSDPLETMTFFDPDGTRRHTELVEQVPALVTSTAQARTLHPAREAR